MSKAEREHSAFQYGSDAKYQAWCQKQPSAYSGKQDYCDDGLMRCEYAHYRTAENAGTGFKPPYSGIPLTHAEHALQHQMGQFNFMPRAWWETEVNKYLEMWIQSMGKK